MDDYLSSLKESIPTHIVNSLEMLNQNKSIQIGLLEDYIERVGIMEFQGRLSRFEAEQKALECIITSYKTKKKK